MTKNTAQHHAARARKIRSVRGVVATYLREISTTDRRTTGDRRKPAVTPTAVTTDPAKA